jgi:hypothetical protein
MFLDDLVTQLEADNVGTLRVNLFRGAKTAVPMLASGAATLHLIETGGGGPEHTQNNTIFPSYLHPSAQLTARADNYDNARAMADAAYRSLVKVRNQFINSGWYRSIKPLQEPNEAMGVDDRGQVRILFNVTADYNRRV